MAKQNEICAIRANRVNQVLSIILYRGSDIQTRVELMTLVLTA